jgi:hypothetical protein
VLESFLKKVFYLKGVEFSENWRNELRKWQKCMAFENIEQPTSKMLIHS